MTEHDPPDRDDDRPGALDDEAHPIDFSSFLLSIGSSALVHLGEIEHPDHAGLGKNLPLAKQSLDMLTMLQDKTRGNLNDDESKLLEQLLYELRLKYVAQRG